MWGLDNGGCAVVDYLRARNLRPCERCSFKSDVSMIYQSIRWCHEKLSGVETFGMFSELMKCFGMV